MSDIAKREFIELTLDGSNYLTWAMDVEIILDARGLISTIIDVASRSTTGVVAPTSSEKNQALHFSRHHLISTLKNEYMTERDPKVLWNSLKECYEKHKTALLPQARHDWNNLRFQDCKIVVDYNSTLHCIVTQLKLYSKGATNDDMIDKTLFTLAT